MQKIAVFTLLLSTIAFASPITVDIAIIGSGPAGWSAALYGARLGHSTLVFTGNTPGGQLTKTSYIENWPGIPKAQGMRLMELLTAQACSYGAQQVFDSVIDVNFSRRPFIIKTEEGSVIAAKTVIIATGSTPRLLGVPGEQEFFGEGVSTCAICDAPLFKNKDVVVIGGGDAAVEEALQLAVYAKSVTMFVRGPQLRASHIMQQKLASTKNITVLNNIELKRIADTSTTSNFYDPVINTGRRDIAPSNRLFLEIGTTASRGPSTTTSTDGVFIAIGHNPNTALFKNKLTLNSHGYIVVTGRSQKTSVPGVCAAGDVTDDSYHQAGVAAGQGIAAAIDTDRFLRTGK